MRSTDRPTFPSSSTVSVTDPALATLVTTGETDQVIALPVAPGQNTTLVQRRRRQRHDQRVVRHVAIHHAALRLDPHQTRACVWLYELALYGDQRDEAAEILAVPLGTVMSRLYRGRARIERALLSYGKRYNYLSHRPAKVRDTAITERELVNSTTG